MLLSRSDYRHPQARHGSDRQVPLESALVGNRRMASTARTPAMAAPMETGSLHRVKFTLFSVAFYSTLADHGNLAHGFASSTSSTQKDHGIRSESLLGQQMMPALHESIPLVTFHS